MKRLASLVLLTLLTGSALAAQRPVVVELFTSLGCSDCPPADLVLTRVHQLLPDVLVLDLHVTYWNTRLWRDPYSLPAVDRMQRRYDNWWGQQVFTPQAVVDGQRPFLGADPRAMLAALKKAMAHVSADPGIPITIGSSTRGVTVRVGPGIGNGVVWLFGFDPERTTPVQEGENAGAKISEVNVVRSVTRLGTWQGQRLQLESPTPAGTGFAAILQKSNGTILGAAVR